HHRDAGHHDGLQRRHPHAARPRQPAQQDHPRPRLLHHRPPTGDPDGEIAGFRFTGNRNSTLTMSTRAEKVASLLKREVTQTIQRELSDPRIEGLVSITRVKVTDDLRDATVYVSVLPAQHGRKVVAALVDGTRHIQKVTQ